MKPKDMSFDVTTSWRKALDYQDSDHVKAGITNLREVRISNATNQQVMIKNVLLKIGSPANDGRTIEPGESFDYAALEFGEFFYKATSGPVIGGLIVSGFIDS